MRHFPILDFFLGGGGVAKGSKSSIMIATLVKNRMKQPPPLHPPENKDKTRESQNMPFIWGGGGS